MVPQPCAAGGNRSYPEFWAVIGDMRYPGYFTLIVASEPSVEWAVKDILSMGHILCAHMLLRALLWDLVARLWG
jgi:hypothetical protein